MIAPPGRRLPAPFRRVAALYGFRLTALLRTYQRWYFGTPYEYVERFVPRRGTVVDLGCGVGLFSNLLAISSEERVVFGVDLDPGKIEIARRTVTPERRNISFRLLDLKDLDLPRVDSIVLYDVAHHLDENVQLSVLRQCHEKLADGGTFILKENDVEPWWKLNVSRLVEIVALGFNITLSSKILWRSRGAWIRLLRDIGFQVVHAEHVRTPYGFFVPHSLFVCRKGASEN